ncbi:hypothetical protein [Actomonas aquatica]|uniref:Glycosyltransferase RgtA/B/C/D-like domain-containing protein n=1 Tax=Actomonas aquatica TaxID=2866162 RepID=A0ABZ1CD00_9BACT|nr:hypothetical protein [Opitutus sp. WL0086]WRQ89549.1 hypothetical protein K1X11_009020 [Opitutus sp. WL0086]
MSPRPPRLTQLLGWLVLLPLAALIAWAGRNLMFSVFMVYDDEGYVLLSLRNAFTAGALYDEVYTQYGPFFYLWHKALSTLGGWEWTHTAGRWLTLGYWLGTVGLCWDITRRLVPALVAQLFALAGTFAYLWIMTNEPTHPGGMIGFLVALAAWIGLRWDPARHPGSAAAIAAVGAALGLSKINTGLFLLAALWGWLALASRASRLGRIVALVTGPLFALAPLVVMHGLWPAPWVVTFALVVAVALTTVVFVGWRHLPVVPTIARSWAAASVGGVLTATVIIGLTLALGSSLRGILEGVLLGPLRHPDAYWFAFNWRPGTRWAALLAVGLMLLAWRRPESALLRVLLHAVRAALMLAVMAAVFGWVPLLLPSAGFTYGLPLAACLAYPLGNDKSAPGRLWLALLVGWQSLHAYPVAVSQLNWGTFLWVPLLAAGVEDSLRDLPLGSTRDWTRRAVGAIGLVVSLTLAGTMALQGHVHRQQGEALGLPGAEDLVMPTATAVPIQIMTLNARHNTDPLFTFAGAYSFNLWSGVRTPTRANVTHWFSLLHDNQKQAIIDELEASPRAGVIVQLDLLRYLQDQGRRVEGPLVDYLRSHFSTALEIDGYALWLKNGREVPLLGVARWATSSRRLDFNLPEPLPVLSAFELWIYTGAERALVSRFSPDEVSLEPATSGSDEPLFSYHLILPDRAPIVDGLLILRDRDGQPAHILRTY